MQCLDFQHLEKMVKIQTYDNKSRLIPQKGQEPPGVALDPNKHLFLPCRKSKGSMRNLKR